MEQTVAENSIRPCGYQPDEQYIAKWKDLNSTQNERLKFLQGYSLEDVFRIKELDVENGSFRLSKTSALERDFTEEDKKKIVPIVAHVVRRNNGIGGLSTADLNAAISTANGLYNTSNFFLNVVETNFIDSDTTFNFSHNDDQTSASTDQLDVINNNRARKLNIYFVPDSTTSWTWRPSHNKRTQHVLMYNGQTNNGTTLSHELGHWFDLLHTHDGGDELVDGSNCKTTGDFCCDTPADPNLSTRLDSNCKYIGTVVDANGDRYNPDTRNLLSYAGSCRNRFSNDQIMRMQSAFIGMQTDRGYTFS